MTPAEILLGLFALALGYRVVKHAATGSVLFPPIYPLEVRSDMMGGGYFGDSRGSRTHQGVDFLCRKGQAVYSPIDGTLERIAYPYGDDLRWQGCVIRGEDADQGIEVKMFYMVPTAPMPRAVSRGDAVGHCQAISEKFTPQMNDHLHVEVREDGVLIDPLPLFTRSTLPA